MVIDEILAAGVIDAPVTCLFFGHGSVVSAAKCNGKINVEIHFPKGTFSRSENEQFYNQSGCLSVEGNVLPQQTLFYGHLSQVDVLNLMKADAIKREKEKSQEEQPGVPLRPEHLVRAFNQRTLSDDLVNLRKPYGKM